jgi:hypothetical protein
VHALMRGENAEIIFASSTLLSEGVITKLSIGQYEGQLLDAQFVETAKARWTRSSCDPLQLVAQNLSPTAHNVRTELGEWGSDTASVPVSRSGRRHRVASGRVLVPCTQRTVSTVAQERSPVVSGLLAVQTDNAGGPSGLQGFCN